MRPKILVIPGSNRTGSYNTRLSGTLVKALALRECEVTWITLRDYPLPLYDADLEREKGVPANAGRLASMVREHDALILVSPEYNASVSPLMKNTIDWISRVRSVSEGRHSPFNGRIIALAAASPGKLGGIRGLGHLRASLLAVGALVLTEQVAVSGAANAFDDGDDLKDAALRDRLDMLCESVIDKAKRLSRRY